LTDASRDRRGRPVEWGAVGAAFWRYFTGHTLQWLSSPRIDARHYHEQERLYVEWIEGMRRAGVPAPNLMVACLLWLAGIGFALRVRRRWLWVLVLFTIAWMVRAFFVDHEEDRDEDPAFEVPLPGDETVLSQ
jgi:hypothetical protein